MTARAVIADDDADYRLLVRLALGPDARFSVVGETGDASQLVAAVQAGDADLALVECDLDGGGGFEAMARLRAAVPQCRVILLSAFGEDELRRASRVAGAVGYLSKDTPASRFADELDTLLALVGAVDQVLAASSSRFDADLQSAREARTFVNHALDTWGMGNVAEIVSLLVSELVTNAVVHARSEVDVVVQLMPDAARVEVSDRSETAPVVRAAGSEDESGRGMAIVDSLSRAWGVRARSGGGKTIWFEVARSGLPVRP